MAFFQKENKNPHPSSAELLKQVKGLEEKIGETTKEIKELKQEMKKAVTKVGIVRFNPFKEIGGDQSFSIALLDEQRNGMVVTSYYGRELNRVYAKSIQNGTSEHDLAEEEKAAINQAMGLENSKKQTQRQGGKK